MLAGDTELLASWTPLCLDGRRPLRPFKLSVLTTAERKTPIMSLGSACPAGVRLCAQLTFLHHAHGETLLESAELAPVAPSFVHGAVLVGQANILGIFLNCALQEETSE